MNEKVDWAKRAQTGFLASGIDPADRRGRKNNYIDLLHKMALKEVLELSKDKTVLDFGCGSGRISYWIAPMLKRVVGLETTLEMIDLARRSRAGGNVEFILYDGAQFPIRPRSFDLELSVWVLQYMRGEILKTAVSALAQYLKPEGIFCLVEQVSDNPKVGRPSLLEYLEAFKASNLQCLQRYPIRNGRWWLLYLIRYGIVPTRCFPVIAKKELLHCRRECNPISYYQDYLFVLRK